MDIIEKIKLTEEVAARIRKEITSGRWQAGHRIPSENQLSETLGVSRVTIRNALQRLMGLGLVESRHGDGTFVSDLRPDIAVNILTPSFLLGDHSVGEVLEFRAVIEVGSAGLAAGNATGDQIVELRRLFSRMQENSDDYESYSHWDFLFHRELAAASCNVMIVKVEDLLREMLESTFNRLLRSTGGPLQIGRHGTIVEHVADRDVAGARAEMQFLMDRFLDNLTRERDAHGS